VDQNVDDYDEAPRRRDRGPVVTLLILALALFLAVPIGLLLLFIVAIGFSNM
jgi:hypothetical protein